MFDRFYRYNYTKAYCLTTLNLYYCWQTHVSWVLTAINLYYMSVNYWNWRKTSARFDYILHKLLMKNGIDNFWHDVKCKG